MQPGNTAEFFVGFTNLNGGFFLIKKYNIAGNTSSQATVVLNNGVFDLGAGYWNLEMQFSELNAKTLYVAGTTLYRVDVASWIGGTQTSSYWATDPVYCTPAARTHADIRSMTVSRSGANDIVILGSDGGIHKALLNPGIASTPTSANWHDMTGGCAGLALNEFFDINGLESQPEVLVGGTQDNGTFEYNNGRWQQRFNYDGWLGTMNQATGQYYGMTNGGPISGPTGTTGTFSFVTGPALSRGPVVSDPNNPAIIYEGAASLYRLTGFGTASTTIPLPGSTNVRTIQVAPSNSNVIYVSRDGPTWQPNNLTGRLFKSSNGGSTWTDIGGGLGLLAWSAVSDIAIDPDDANRVWISINGFWPASPNSINGANRVYFSGDGGATWTDFTFNLLAFPVSCLIYQRGSDDALYAGTDVGVFRYNKSTQLWECFNNHLPVVPVTRLEINYCKNKVRAATYGRGIYESDLPALPSDVVSTSTTWSGLVYLSNDLTIASGATLTLTGTLYMSRGRRIIVRRGATLNLNGGTITNACGDMWYGIELWGTTGAPQNLAFAQGKVLMQNNARIENAIAAITTGKDVNTTVNPTYTGGIVQASNSFFRNNQSSVRFLSYHWLAGPGELSNMSFFKDCTFETNRRLNDAALLPTAHVYFNDIKNVALLGCKFSNTAATSVFSANDRGDGVVSVNALYGVDDLSNFSSLIAPSIFNGLTYGVRADFNFGTAIKNVTVANSDFNNVQRGVQIRASRGSVVTANNFTAVPNALTTNLTNATWGVRIETAANFSINANTVTGANPAFQNSYGVIVDSCANSPSNLVKGNTLKNLYTGILARGANGTGANGVQFRCNVFQPAMAYQLSVESGGTLANQGNTCTLGQTADNTFFAQAIPAGSQINAAGVPFTYYASGSVPANVTASVTVTNCSNNVSGECP